MDNGNQIGNWCLLDSYQSCSFVFVYEYDHAYVAGFRGQDVYDFFSAMVGTCSKQGQLVAVVGVTSRDPSSQGIPGW